MTEKIQVNPKEGKEDKGTKNDYMKQKATYRMVDLNPVLSIIVVSVNALNPAIKRQELSDCINYMISITSSL